MTFYITGLEYARDRVQEPFHVSKMHVRQRTWDETSQTYETTQGNAFTVERMMPVPYNLKINLDIWTSNINQKLQLVEQIGVLFNPSFEIQSTDNYIDWTSLSVVELTSTNFSSRTIPVGTENPIDIATFSFELPIWLSPPAKVKKLGVVHKIIASMYNASGDINDAIADSDLLLGTRQKITPYGYQILLIGNQLQVLKKTQTNITVDQYTEIPEISSNLVWSSVIEPYGVLKDGISQIRLQHDDLDTEIIGTVAQHPSDDKYLLYTIDIDTLPQNTLDPVNGVIDPQRSGPGSGLPEAEDGQRYLLTDNIGSIANTDPAAAWGPVVANANDIIEFDGGEWAVVFSASEPHGTAEFVTNIRTGIQFRWTGQEWLRSYEGLYDGGQWSLVL